MKIIQSRILETGKWEMLRNDHPEAESIQLVIATGSNDLVINPEIFQNIRSNYPNAALLINSSCGDINECGISELSVSVTAIAFEKTKIKSAMTTIDVARSSFNAGYYLARALDPAGLKNVLVIAGGSKFSGSDLVSSLSEYLPEHIIISGGIAGNNHQGAPCMVGLNRIPEEGCAAVIGFYGNDLSVTSSSLSGWEPFGPERIITKANGRILIELDNMPALDFYRLYLGKDMMNMPGNGLLFPMSIRMPDTDDSVLRTIVSIDESRKSIEFASPLPSGAYARFMKTNAASIINAASQAAQHAVRNIMNKPELALLISGAGRKVVLNSRMNEEIEVVKSVLGSETAIAGFYAHGEISPVAGFQNCRFQNQTMTITAFSEK